MDRQEHAAIFLRMMAVKEVILAKHSKGLLVNQAKKIATEYSREGQHVIERNLQDGVAQWGKLLIATYHSTIMDFSQYTFEQTGQIKKSGAKAVHMSNFLRLVTQFIQSEALKRSITINHTTRKIITEVLLQGEREGLGNEQIARNIRKKITDLSSWRAATIARTETHNAATWGQQKAAEQSVEELIKEWVAVHDKRTREWHADADGQQRDLHGLFDVDDEQISRPGEGSAENSINCRCCLIYTPKLVVRL